MPTDFERDLALFAEALDREAPAISVDEIIGRGTGLVDVDRLERQGTGRHRRDTAVSWGDALPGPGENGEHDVRIELAATDGRHPARGRVALRLGLAAAAAAVLVVALAAIVGPGDESDPADVPTSTVPASSLPTTAPTDVPTSGGMWPQADVDEVRTAQELADAGNADYTWQVDSRLVDDDSWVGERHRIELVDRFLREELGWEAYELNPFQGMGRNGVYDVAADQRYLRCAPGRTNPLYPPGSEPEWGQSCAPTIDDLHYESVSIDLAQPDRKGPDGIWVVSRWELTRPFEQADPAAVEADALDRLERFLAARVAGAEADGFVALDPGVEAPLLYAASGGGPYERYQIERVDGPSWPAASMTFVVRLFADGDATVVEQVIRADRGYLWLDSNSTTENDRPVVQSYTSSDGEVAVSAPSTWQVWLPGKGAGQGGHEQALDVWFGSLWRPDEFFGSGERIELVDPVAYDAWCADNGGSPLLTAPADAAAIAQQLTADPNFETTAPVAARIGGMEAVAIDVTLAPGGRACGVGMIDISRWIHAIGWDQGWRLRLYLVDLPEGMSVPTLAITVVAPEGRFDDLIAETAPIIDSIEFRSG